MKLSVPTNWDPELLERLNDYPVQDIYGVADEGVIGAGRPRWILPVVGKGQIARHIKKARSSGKTFTYLLNAPCLNNIEYSRGFRSKIREHVKWISGMGVDYVTVTIPYLIEIIKHDFPDLKLKASTILHVNSVQRAKFIEGLGVDEITLDFMANRDFHLLEKIKRSVKPAITLILNDICLYQCPFRYYHYNVVGHSSQTSNPFKGFYLDYCLTKCVPIRFGSFEEMLKIRWIRPEDLTEYEKIGIDSFKISGRSHSTEWILRAVKAYTSQRYDGNLIDILDCMESAGGKKIERRLSSLKKYSNLVHNAFHLPFRLYKDYYNWYRAIDKISQSIHIDNNKLSGFIGFFKNNDCLSSCAACDYCQRWARKAISCDQKRIDEYVAAVSAISKKLIFGQNL